MASFQEDGRYTGAVRSGSWVQGSKNGTPGFQLALECPEGRTTYTIWVTPKNKTRAAKDFETLGVSAENLRNKAYLNFQLGADVVGKGVCFGMKGEDWQGRRVLKVAWIGPVRAAGESQLVAEVADLFGEAQTSSAPPPAPEPSDDYEDDIPF